MTAPPGFIETVADIDALPILVAAGEIMLISKLAPSAGDAKTMILLRSGERLTIATEYNQIVHRLALCVGTDESRKGT